MFTAAYIALMAAQPIVADSLTRNLGVIRAEDGAASATFVLTNDADSPLVITDVKTSCSCTRAAYTRRQLAVGDTAHVTLTYNPLGRLGEVDGTAVVYTSATDSAPAARLSLTGRVVTDDPFPHLPVLLGRSLRVARKTVTVSDLKAGQRRREALPCGNVGDRPVTVKAALLPPYVTLSSSPAPIPPGREADLVFTIDGTAVPVGTTRVPVVLTGIDGRPSDSTLTLTISK